MYEGKNTFFFTNESMTYNNVMYTMILDQNF